MNRSYVRLRSEVLEDRAVPTTFYVAPAGSNANVGTSAAAPWLTLQYAAGKVAAGDTVVVAAGNYTGFHLTTSGTAAARITFSAQPGATITARNPVTPDGINLEGASHVTVEGFTVTGMPRTGIRAVTNDFVIIRNNSLDLNGRWGILTGFSDDLLIEGNVCSRSVAEHGIYVGNSGDRPVIRGNTCWGNNANGIHMNGDLSAGDGGGTTDGDGVISNAVVENNTLYDNGAAGGSGINCDGVQNSTVRNNLIYNTRASGISLYQIDGGQPSTGNRVVNNTVLVSAAGRWALNVSDASTGNTVRNNVFYSYHSFRGAVSVSADSLGGFTSDYNAVEDRFSADGGDTGLSLAAWRAASGQDTHSFTLADPTSLFVNAAAGDYHLRAGSAVIDRGTSEHAPSYDFEADVRPQGAGYDIGCDEFPVSLTWSPPPVPFRVPLGGQARLFAFDISFGGGLNVADLIAGQAGRGSAVRVIDGRSMGVASGFAPFGGFAGGSRVTAADVTGDGKPDAVVGAMRGGGPRYQRWTAGGVKLFDRFAYDAGFDRGIAGV